MFQSYDEESQSSNNVPYQPPMHNQGGNIIFMTDPTEDIELIKWNLKGYEKVNNEWKQKTEPLMNDLGINTVIDYINNWLESSEDKLIVVIETYHQIPCLQTTFENVEGLCSLGYFKSE